MSSIDGAQIAPKCIKSKQAPSRARQFVEAGDTLLSGVRVYLRNIAMVPDDQVDVASTAFCVLRPGPDLDARFMHRWISSDWFINALIPLQRGNSPPAVLDADVRDQPIPVPPLDVQRAISARIDALFAEIDEGEAALARARAGVETYAKALLKAAVTGELTADWRAEQAASGRPQETGEQLLARILADRRARWHADPKNARKTYIEPAGPDTDGLPELPEGWTWASISQLGVVSGGVTQNSKRNEHPLKLPFLRVANVYANRLDMRVVEEIGVQPAELERVTLEKGDLLIVEGNGSIDQIGRSCLWDGSIDPCVHQNHLIKVRFGLMDIGPWVQTWLQSPNGRRELEEQASSTSGLHTLSISKVGGLRVPVPPMAEMLEAQRQREQISEQQIDATDAVEAQVALSATLRQSILAAAFRGELAA